MLSAVNSDTEIAVELPQPVMKNANAATIKVITFFFSCCHAHFVLFFFKPELAFVFILTQAHLNNNIFVNLKLVNTRKF